jgi:hypothetical protein
MRILKLAFVVYLLSYVVLGKCMFECKVRYNGCRFMRSDDTLHYFAFILVGKFVLKYARHSGTRLSHKMPPHRTHVNGYIFCPIPRFIFTALYDLWAGQLSRYSD